MNVSLESLERLINEKDYETTLNNIEVKVVKGSHITLTNKAGTEKIKLSVKDGLQDKLIILHNLETSSIDTFKSLISFSSDDVFVEVLNMIIINGLPVTAKAIDISKELNIGRFLKSAQEDVTFEGSYTDDAINMAIANAWDKGHSITATKYYTSVIFEKKKQTKVFYTDTNPVTKLDDKRIYPMLAYRFGEIFDVEILEDVPEGRELNDYELGPDTLNLLKDLHLRYNTV